MGARAERPRALHYQQARTRRLYTRARGARLLSAGHGPCVKDRGGYRLQPLLRRCPKNPTILRVFLRIKQHSCRQLDLQSTCILSHDATQRLGAVCSRPWREDPLSNVGAPAPLASVATAVRKRFLLTRFCGAKRNRTIDQMSVPRFHLKLGLQSEVAPTNTVGVISGLYRTRTRRTGRHRD